MYNKSYSLDQIHPPLFSECSLQGSIGKIAEKFFEARIFSKEAHNVIYREAANAFKNQVDDESGLFGIWQGEFWGKWIISAVRVCEYSSREDLKEFICRGVKEILKYQREDGYLGTYKNPEFVCPLPQEQVKAILGYENDWNWNIWCRKYTLWGLLEAYQLLGDPEILTGAAKSADQLISMLGRLNLKSRETGTFCGLASCSILKPMLLLYEMTGKQLYLDFCLDIAAEWERPDGGAPNLIANAFAGTPIHTWYPVSVFGPKTYEMLSCLDGLLELYRVTGNVKYLEAVKKLYELIKEHELNPLFGVGYNDQFRHAAAYLNGISEPCDSIHWMRLCHELFKLTGEAKYIDSFELTFYNAFLAGVYRDGEWGARGVRTSGRHLTAFIQAKFTHNHCCVNNMPRGLLNAAESFVMASSDCLYINLYTDFKGKMAVGNETATVDISGSYLSNGKAVFHFNTSEKIPVAFRIPAWSTHAILTLNGKTEEITTHGFFKTKLPAGASCAEITFDFVPEIHRFPCRVERPNKEDWHTIRWTEGEKSNVSMEKMYTLPHARVTVGPLLLARSKYIGNTEEEMFDSPSIQGGGYTGTIQSLPDNRVRSAFELKLDSPGDSRMLKVCDYASAGNEILNDDIFFSIFF